MIPRLYDVSEGKVLVDGVNVKDYDLHELNNRIGYVPQKAVIFTGYVSYNVSYGDNGRGMILFFNKYSSASGYLKDTF